MLMDLIFHQMSHAERNYLLHYHVSDGFEKFDRRMGLLLVILSVLVTASIGLSLSQPQAIDKSLVLGIGFLSLGVSVLTSVMTFLNLKEKSFSHSRAAENYYYLQAKMRAFVGRPDLESIGDDDIIKIQKEYTEEIRKLHSDSPSVPGWAYKNAEKVISSYQNTSDKIKEHQNNWLAKWFSVKKGNKSIKLATKESNEFNRIDSENSHNKS